MLNPIEEAKFAELKERCRELGVPAPPEVFIGVQVHDKNGVLIFDGVQRGRSWTRNFYNFLFGAGSDCVGDGTDLFDAGKMSVKRTNGNIFSYTSGHIQRVSTDVGSGFCNNGMNANYGIVVGSGTLAFDLNQFALDGLIATGANSGQLAYQAMTNPEISSYTAGTKTWETTHLRVFNNNSQATVTVKEVGLYWYGNAFGGQSYYMLERSLLSPVVDVPVGGQLTVTYKISMVFSID